MAAGLLETRVKDDCPGHSAEANITGPQRWPGLCPLLNDDQESHLGSEVLSDFDVLWAENYNKRRQMVWSMRIHYNEIDKVTGKIRQICQGGRIRNNSRAYTLWEKLGKEKPGSRIEGSEKSHQPVPWHSGAGRPVGLQLAMNLESQIHWAAGVASPRAVESLCVTVTSVSVQPSSGGGPGIPVVSGNRG